jgi:hypothetical protein
MTTKINYKNILLAICFFGIIFFAIWILFIIKGPFKVGNGLGKSDWLIFAGGYLSFVGTISITYLVIIQNKNYHEIEQDKLRYSQLPYIKIKLANKKKLVPSGDGNYILDFPSLTFENDKFIWKGGQTGINLIIPSNQIDLVAIYEIQNIGLGRAMKISLHSNDSDYSFRDHLKIEDSLYFIIDIASLKRESQKIILFVKFCDVYNNKYQQKLSCEFNIVGTIFNFNISQEQFEPEFIKN